MPNRTAYNAMFITFVQRLIFHYLSATSYGNIDYYLHKFKMSLKVKLGHFWILKSQNDSFLDN